jgi:hypothetical protein
LHPAEPGVHTEPYAPSAIASAPPSLPVLASEALTWDAQSASGGHALSAPASAPASLPVLPSGVLRGDAHAASEGHALPVVSSAPASPLVPPPEVLAMSPPHPPALNETVSASALASHRIVDTPASSSLNVSDFRVQRACK